MCFKTLNGRGKIDLYSEKKTASKEAIFKGEQDKQLTFHVEHFSGRSQVRSRTIHFNNWLPTNRCDDRLQSI
jgi:hypothetical protein